MEFRPGRAPPLGGHAWRSFVCVASVAPDGVVLIGEDASHALCFVFVMALCGPRWRCARPLKSGVNEPCDLVEVELPVLEWAGA